VVATLLALGLLANVLATLWNVQAVSKQEQAVSQTEATLTQVHGVMTNLDEAEVGMLRYVLSGDREYLQLYLSARSQVVVEMRQLRVSVDSTAQKQQVDAIQQQAISKLDDMQKLITLRQTGQTAEALNLLGSSEAQPALSQLRAEIGQIEGAENRMLSDQKTSAAGVSRSALEIFLAMLAGNLLLLALAFALLWRTAALRERVAREMAQAEAQTQVRVLQETTRRMDDYIGIASHELKTPLTAMKGNLQLIARQLRRVVSAEQQGEMRALDIVEPLLPAIDRTVAGTNRLERLVNDLLDLSRIQGGKLLLRPAHFDLIALVRDCVEEQRLEHPERSVVVAAEEETRAVEVLADADRIRQTLTNYLTNALKYSRPEQPVHVAVVKEGERMVRVSVRDEGVGFSAAEQEHIWERFYQAPGSAVQSGSGVGLGLGLYISKTIIELHGGQVGCEGAPGAGATFWFTLPVAGEQEAASAMNGRSTDAGA
jgi:signal transduction histidine kinase